MAVKFVVFGASASAQTVKHDTKEVTGYCEVLRRRFLGALGASALQQICYGGNRLSDGGLYRLGEVVAARPGVCIVEPLVEDTTRGQYADRNEALFIYETLLKARILPVTLLLPQPARRTPDKWPTYEMFKRICADFGLPVIEVDLTGVAELDKKFEGIHTRLVGAELYAQAVVDGVRRLGDLPTFADHVFATMPPPGASLFETTVEVPDTAVVRRIALRLRARDDAGFAFRVVQPQFVGPFSPVLQVIATWTGGAEPGQAMTTRSLWDPYCHYERRSYAVLEDRPVEAGHTGCILSVTMSPEDPAYAESRRPVERWPAAAERCMKPWGKIKVFSTAPLEAALVDYR